MPMRITAANDSKGITLPNGWAMEAGDVLVVDDNQWALIERDRKLLSNISVSVYTTDPITPVPSWRDHQRAAAAWETGDPLGGTGGGTEGPSAYDVAVANGFVGTETQWLASLKGDPGSQGNPGPEGPEGDSAYEVAVANGFVGTEAEWLESLKATSGTDAQVIVAFASAATTWTVTHNLGQRYVDVITVDHNGEEILGAIEYVDANTVAVHWYYPTSGTARVSL